MRKADYTALADVLRAKLFDAAKLKNFHNPGSVGALTADARFNLVLEIAHGFANRASVDKAAFLKACGIE